MSGSRGFIPGESRRRVINGGGGSQKGKIQNRWPWVIKVVAESIATAAKGSEEAWTVDGTCPWPEDEWARIVEAVLPGVWEWCAENMRVTKDPFPGNLWNRVYKMYYSGTSDRGPNHDPLTRAVKSREHWHYHIPRGNVLWDIAEAVQKGTRRSIPEWRDYLSEPRNQRSAL